MYIFVTVEVISERFHVRRDQHVIKKPKILYFMLSQDIKVNKLNYCYSI